MKHAVCSVAGMTMIRVELKDLLSVPKSDWHEALKNDELSSQIRRRLEMNKQPLLDIMKDNLDRIVDLPIYMIMFLQRENTSAPQVYKLDLEALG